MQIMRALGVAPLCPYCDDAIVGLLQENQRLRELLRLHAPAAFHSFSTQEQEQDHMIVTSATQQEDVDAEDVNMVPTAEGLHALD